MPGRPGPAARRRPLRRARNLALSVLVLGSSLAGCYAETGPISWTPGPTPVPSSSVEAAGPVPGLSPSPGTTPPANPIEPSPSPTPVATPGPTPTPAPGAALDVPILYLHRVRPVPADIGTWSATRRATYLRYMITPCELGAQLDWLAAHGYHTILPRDLAAYWDHGVPLPPWPVIITFDDGFPGWHDIAFPMLVARGMVAEFYVTIANAGGSLSWADLREMARAGMGIGAHDVNHFQLTGGVPPASVGEMRYQVTAAKRILEQELGITVDSMAYVGGGYDSTLLQIVRGAGYTTARSVNRGISQPESRRFRLRVSWVGFWDDVVDHSLTNAQACVLDPTMSRFASRVSGSHPG